MSKNLDEIELASNLIALTGLSMSKVARSVAISPGNLSNWLRGNRTALGAEGKDRLFSNMGIAGGALDPRKVHIWTMKKSDLTPFYSVLKWLSQPFEIFHIAPHKLSVRDYFPDRYSLPLIAYNQNTRIVLLRKIYSLESNIPPIDPAFLPEGSHWRVLPKDSYFQFVVKRIPNEIYSRCISGELTPEEFDLITKDPSLETSSPPDWDSVVNALERLGFDPASALDWISKTSSLKKDP